LENAKLYNAKLENAKLYNAKLENAKLENANLENAKIGKCEIGKCKIGKCKQGTYCYPPYIRHPALKQTFASLIALSYAQTSACLAFRKMPIFEFPACPVLLSPRFLRKHRKHKRFAERHVSSLFAVRDTSNEKL